jgi:hypothetical protein
LHALVGWEMSLTPLGGGGNQNHVPYFCIILLDDLSVFLPPIFKYCPWIAVILNIDFSV